MAEDFDDEDLDEEESVDENEDEEDEEDDEEAKLEDNANKKIILNKFKKMKLEYMATSVAWPYLTSSQKSLCKKVQKISPSEYASFMSTVESKKAAFSAKIQSAAASIIPVLPFILIGLLIIIGIAVIISILMPWLTGSSGNPSAPFGANGKSFYGVRYVYRDAEQAKDDLWADYVGAMSYTIENFSDENITLKIDLPAENLLGNIPMTGVDSKYANAYNLTLEIAKAVYISDNSAVENVETEVDAMTADELLAGIKYFGFDAEIVEQIATNWAELIELETLYEPNETSGGGTTDISDTSQPKFASLLLDEYVTKLQIEDGAPTRTDLLYIKDYILGDDEESTVEDVKQEDYVAMIYLPKANAKISSVTFSIRGVQAEDYSIGLWQNGAEIVAKDEQSFTVFTSKEEAGDDYDNYHFEAANIDLAALTMTAYQKEFLTTEKSLISILRALKTENDGANATLTSQYLQVADADNTAFWADGSQEEEESEMRYLTFNYQTYLAVLMNNTAATPYMFYEFETNLG